MYRTKDIHSIISLLLSSFVMELLLGSRSTALQLPITSLHWQPLIFHWLPIKSSTIGASKTSWLRLYRSPQLTTPLFHDDHLPNGHKVLDL